MYWELRKAGPNRRMWVTGMHWELGKAGPNRRMWVTGGMPL